jgi:hypothetical protein
MEYWALVHTDSDKEVEFSAWSLVGILRIYLDHHLRVYCQGHPENQKQVVEELGIDNIDEAIKNIETDEALKQKLVNWIEDTDYKILKGILTNPAPFPLKNVESQFVTARNIDENTVDIVHMLDHALSSQRDTTHDVIRKAATTLILKHKAYLEMTFFNHPNTLSSALYDEELGLNSILRSCVIPYKDLVLTPEICQHVFETAVCNGITYHERVCGIKSFQGKILSCNPLGGKCLITKDICAPKLCLNLEEANVLSNLLRFSAKEIRELDAEEEYTAGTIVRILN